MGPSPTVIDQLTGSHPLDFPHLLSFFESYFVDTLFGFTKCGSRFQHPRHLRLVHPSTTQSHSALLVSRLHWFLIVLTCPFVAYAFWRLAFRFVLPAFANAPLESSVLYLIV
jgi:hypothetical protein